MSDQVTTAQIKMLEALEECRQRILSGRVIGCAVVSVHLDLGVHQHITIADGSTPLRELRTALETWLSQWGDGWKPKIRRGAFANRKITEH